MPWQQRPNGDWYEPFEDRVISDAQYRAMFGGGTQSIEQRWGPGAQLVNGPNGAFIVRPGEAAIPVMANDPMRQDIERSVNPSWWVDGLPALWMAGAGGMALAGAGGAGGAAEVGAYGGMDNAAVSGLELGGTELAAPGFTVDPATGDTVLGSTMSAASGGTGAIGQVGTAGATAGGTALGRLLDGAASGDDLLELLGRGAPAALGAFAADRQSDALERLSGQYMEMGAPSRSRFEESFAPGFSMESDPGYKDALDQTTKSFLHKASIGGNPADSPNAWNQTLMDVNASFAYPALQDYRKLNANAGGLSRFAEAAPSAATGAINAQKGVYDAIGAGAADIFNPPRRLEDLLRSVRSAGY